MSDDRTTPLTPARGRTRWLRFTVVLITSTGLAAGLVTATATAAVPTAFAFSGTNFKFSAKRVEGDGFAQFVGIGEDQDAVVVTSIGSARVEDLCFSALVPSLVGEVTIVARAGGDEAVEASDLVLNLSDMHSDATLTNLVLGADAGEVDRGARGVTGKDGDYAHQADAIVIDDLRSTSGTTTAGVFKLTGLHITAVPGRQECF
ncbi:DUF6230 family protein [Saccharothrix longispora]|uniref:Cholesterol esterase n=1 Tax=Saccharothrix longispora TaxID=33920 RepID=A0ABU1PV22_9PSEU|nr:DUF6230 family protein [Saccharothrix longispora]MDR6594498.1 hypothetical protein [Saccharothrix longispora]